MYKHIINENRLLFSMNVLTILNTSITFMLANGRPRRRKVYVIWLMGKYRKLTTIIMKLPTSHDCICIWLAIIINLQRDYLGWSITELDIWRYQVFVWHKRTGVLTKHPPSPFPLPLPRNWRGLYLVDICQPGCGTWSVIVIYLEKGIFQKYSILIIQPNIINHMHDYTTIHKRIKTFPRDLVKRRDGHQWSECYKVTHLEEDISLAYSNYQSFGF